MYGTAPLPLLNLQQETQPTTPTTAL